MDEQRNPVNIRLIGVMHKEKSKLYMTAVLWSDQNEIVIYRKFKDFRTLHYQLKKKYEPSTLSPLRKTDRIVPKFKGLKVKRSIQKKSISKSMLRLKPLEEYCMSLLNAHPQVAQSSELIQFLLPRPDDLKPEFSQNSIIVMPSEEATDRGETQRSDNGVTQPFVTQTYRCIASYDTKDTKNRAFKVEMGESVEVLIKDKGGWWLVENEAKCLAWFPAPYLEKAELDDEYDDQADTKGALYVAAKGYKSTHADELSVEIGTVVEVLQKSDDGWWLVRYNHKTGYIPSMYLQPYINPRVRLISDHKDISARLRITGHELSRSQGNLLQLPGEGTGLLNKSKSHSENVLTDIRLIVPTIEVQTVEESRVRSLSEGSKGGSSDDGDTSSCESLCASSPEDFRRSLTPEPTYLSPDAGNNGRMASSSSEPNLFKMPSTPKVPPRPQVQEILQRCTTVTRKNASRNQTLSPVGIVPIR